MFGNCLTEYKRGALQRIMTGLEQGDCPCTQGDAADSKKRKLETMSQPLYTIKVFNTTLPDDIQQAFTKFVEEFRKQEEGDWNPSRYTDLSLTDRCSLVLLFHNSSVAAAIRCKIIAENDGSRTAMLSHFQAVPKGKGAGSFLLNDIIQSLQRTGVDWVHLKVHYDRVMYRLQEYYESWGFCWLKNAYAISPFDTYNDNDLPQKDMVLPLNWRTYTYMFSHWFFWDPDCDDNGDEEEPPSTLLC